MILLPSAGTTDLDMEQLGSHGSVFTPCCGEMSTRPIFWPLCLELSRMQRASHSHLIF